MILSICSSKLLQQTAAVTCRGSDGSSYRPGQSWSLEAGSKTFVCECKVSGRTHCDWAQNKSKQLKNKNRSLIELKT